MDFIRVATMEEVLWATPDDEATRNVVRAHAPFGVWLFDGDDIGSVGAQLPNGTMGTISSLFPEWKAWLASTDPRAAGSTALHEALMQVLRGGGSFSTCPIVLGPTMQIHDGRHRLFAAFEFLSQSGDNHGVEIFWDRPH